uniref:Uncharacterized protein n=1 Tax=Chromera velia CCMP2878 TaxID=1169474 RepID=A0A0G4G3B2_9ALVE|eukprot:Cvel_19945.t1-p1 / transcript=Cvel_19945.t1 / gene=Cvel_19945 / organism=Chromera_velia_CCMP2878 / gene_product=hypothetical protein / transcript_product=hypothetical protein / location=Cvel_scaffold1755:9628-9918(+) / protein_length=97 / sequence_SO=supercontig / SO=protein_coding / is_pseudo=false
MNTDLTTFQQKILYQPSDIVEGEQAANGGEGKCRVIRQQLEEFRDYPEVSVHECGAKPRAIDWAIEKETRMAMKTLAPVVHNAILGFQTWDKDFIPL